MTLASSSFLRVQSQVDEVIDVMQENISKVIERGERLDDLQDKSGEVVCSVAHPTGDMLLEIHSAAIRKQQNTAWQTLTVGNQSKGRDCHLLKSALSSADEDARLWQPPQA